MLTFVPLGLLAGFLGWPSSIMLVLNALAILPLTSGMVFAMEGFTSRMGDRLGTWAHAIFGSTANVLVSHACYDQALKIANESLYEQVRSIALYYKEDVVVRSSIIGHMVYNLTFQMGLCFAGANINLRPQTERAPGLLFTTSAVLVAAHTEMFSSILLLMPSLVGIYA